MNVPIVSVVLGLATGGIPLFYLVNAARCARWPWIARSVEETEGATTDIEAAHICGLIRSILL